MNKKNKFYYCQSFLFFAVIHANSSVASEGIKSKENTSPASINFDIDSLKSLGYGAEVAEFFMKGNQFLPGRHDVTIKLNGSNEYTENVEINDTGELCLTSELMNKFKLKKVNLSEGCNTFQRIYPEGKITLHPNSYKIDMVIAETHLDPKLQGNELTYGGFGLLSNYQLYGMYISGNYGQQFTQGEFETGINWKNWILRNNSSMSAGESKSQYQFNETVLSKSIEPLQSKLDIGQLNAQGVFFGGTPIDGIQIYSDSSLQSANALVVPVTGFASSPSTVEIQQNGRLLYRTMVSAGAFELNRINNVVIGSPLDVTVIQDNGEQQKFQVVTANQLSQASSSTSYSLVSGRYRSRDNQQTEKPMVTSAELSHQYGDSNYAAGALYSDKFQAVSGRMSSYFNVLTPVSTGVGIQSARNSEKRGEQIDFNTNINFDKVSVGASVLYRTNQFPTLDSSLLKNDFTQDTQEKWNGWYSGEIQTSSSLFASWGDIKWGRFSGNINHTHFYGNKSDTIFYSASYGRKIADISLTVNYQTGDDQDSRFFINASMPLGKKKNISMQSQHGQDKTMVMANFNQQVSDNLRYSVGTGRNDNTSVLNGSINNTNAYSNISVSGSMSQNNTRSVMVAASGGLAYSDGLLATSSVPLGDTFGIVYIPGEPGVRVNTLGSGTTITNHFGTAAISSLPMNQKSTVQLNTEKLPLNVRLDTTSFDVAAARGSVITKRINSTKMRQLLLSIKMENGDAVPFGASVLNEKGDYMGVIMGEGNLLLSNEQIGNDIILRSPNSNDCIIKYTVPKEFSAESLYEEADALCH
ncbi:fimbria/pilus outer membrane usher protein [Providencia rustigianii]|uniref:fimbria/pilus outer membrane usher protein n=1 Tax=Providencia rustigianii TaxID=158850 RepID=UPI000D9EBDD8|nr:fimbria/pilus outer membrane usher protein [Providencia rustigianii]SPY76703.1 Outer membrane usher protein fimD precursor [Providencia rustigianii]